MKKLLILVIFCLYALFVKAQKADVKGYEPYGKIDQADLEMRSCDFEKDANAEVLFDKGVIERNVLTRHVRIKIFNQLGVPYANTRLVYISYMGINSITGFKAETINMENGKEVISAVDAKAIYDKKIDKYFSSLVFAFPNVKAGSIIEYKYSTHAFPSWYFQSSIPTRYSEIEVSFPGTNKFSYVPHVAQTFVKSVGEGSDIYQDKVLTNVPSLPDEAFMGARQYNLQRMEYIGVFNGLSWRKLGQLLVQFNDFGGQFHRSLTGEAAIIKQAAELKTTDQKVAYIFHEVKKNMHWNENRSFAVDDGTVSAWDKKTGNSAEINLILYHLLKKSGIDAYPMITGSKKDNRINPFYPDPFAFSNTVVYIPIDTTNIDSAKYYVLDATNRYNLYNEPPENDLNTFNLLIDEDNYNSHPVFLEDRDPIMRSVFINAEIKTDGKMHGTAQVNNAGYNRTNTANHYKNDSEKEYKNYLTDNNNNLKILSVKTENLETDSLPLMQNIIFDQEIAGTDDNYIYFNTNMFISPAKNPFLKEARWNDIDFGYLDKTVINGIFKVPAGYKIDALPQSMSIALPDGGITFRRRVVAQDGVISINYIINHKKSTYFKEDYPDFHEFFKKMYEMLNEQIVLKKS